MRGAQKLQCFYFWSMTICSAGFFALWLATALSKVPLTCWHITIRSCKASFSTSFAGSPVVWTLMLIFLSAGWGMLYPQNATLGLWRQRECQICRISSLELQMYKIAGIHIKFLCKVHWMLSATLLNNKLYWKKQFKHDDDGNNLYVCFFGVDLNILLVYIW